MCMNIHSQPARQTDRQTDREQELSFLISGQSVINLFYILLTMILLRHICLKQTTSFFFSKPKSSKSLVQFCGVSMCTFLKWWSKENSFQISNWRPLSLPACIFWFYMDTMLQRTIKQRQLELWAVKDAGCFLVWPIQRSHGNQSVDESGLEYPFLDISVNKVV